MNLLCFLLMACTNPQSAGKAPYFNPAGLFDLTASPDQTFTTRYRDGTSELETGPFLEVGVDESQVIEVTYDRQSRTATIDGIAVVLGTQTYEYDTGWSDTASEGWPGRSGITTLEAEAIGTLSSLIGPEYDLAGADCNLSATTTLSAQFSASGEDATFGVEQTYDFDNSASCRMALSTLQEKIYEGGTIPAFFFNWAFSQALNFSKLDQLESMAFSYSILGTQIGDEIATDSVPTTAPEFARSQSALKKSMSRTTRTLFGTPRSVRARATPSILNSSR